MYKIIFRPLNRVLRDSFTSMFVHARARIDRVDRSRRDETRQRDVAFSSDGIKITILGRSFCIFKWHQVRASDSFVADERSNPAEPN